MPVADSRTRRLALISGKSGTTEKPLESGLADVRTLQRRAEETSTPEDERSLFMDTLAEYCWARDVAGLSPATLESLVQPVVQVCSFYDTVPWRLTPRDVDRYFAGPGKAARHSTMLSKITRIDGFFAFLEQRYAGEILRRFGVAVESPIDSFNRPRHRGDFGLRIPPSARAVKEFFASWREELPTARKYPVAVRSYVMAKLTYISGVRAAELCGVRIGDVHWENGQWGRFLVRGKGSKGSGPREREAFLFKEGRELLWWYVEDVRGEFGDDASDPHAALFPSERLPSTLAALNLPVAPALLPDAFRRSLKDASRRHLRGPVTEVFPHLLRHACATHNYEAGMPLWDVQVLLGHTWASTTVGYLNPRELHQAGEKPQLGWSRRGVEGLQRFYELAA